MIAVLPEFAIGITSPMTTISLKVPDELISRRYAMA
jgi:hypothetical protein